MARRLRTSIEANSVDSPIRLKSKARVGMLASVSALLDIAHRLSKKLKANKPSHNYNSKVAPNKSAMMSKPKQLISTISNKAITFLHKKKVGEESEDGIHREEEEWGKDGVWQRSILMGDKCEPLDFSGAIFYDSNGNQLNHAPLRSPRASPLPGYLERANRN